MDNNYVTGAMGVLVILGAFWIYMKSQFVSKEISDLHMAHLSESLTKIEKALDSLRETTIVKSTINEMADRMIEVYDARLSMRERN